MAKDDNFIIRFIRYISDDKPLIKKDVYKILNNDKLRTKFLSKLEK